MPRTGVWYTGDTWGNPFDTGRDGTGRDEAARDRVRHAVDRVLTLFLTPPQVFTRPGHTYIVQGRAATRGRTAAPQPSRLSRGAHLSKGHHSLLGGCLQAAALPRYLHALHHLDGTLHTCSRGGVAFHGRAEPNTPVCDQDPSYALP